MERFTSPKEPHIDILRRQLEDAGVDTANWGKGEAKTLAHLQKEIDEGESLLVADEDGKLRRKVVVAGADVYYVSPEGRKFRLKEERQVFKDGRVRTRKLSRSLVEKMKPDEDPKAAAIRGLREELGLASNSSLTELGIDENQSASQSYPGLHSQYVRHNYGIVLSDEQFNPSGYVEEQDDKNTYFVWEEVE